MNDLKIYQNEEFGAVRTLTIEGDPWFVGKDVADILGYSNNRKAIADHVDEEDKGVTKCDTLGGVQDLVVINESGVFSMTPALKGPNSIWTLGGDQQMHGGTKRYHIRRSGTIPRRHVFSSTPGSFPEKRSYYFPPHRKSVSRPRSGGPAPKGCNFK